MRNSDFNGRGDQPALDELAQTDLLLDALAARTEGELGDPRDFGDFDDRALADLLGDWRDDLRWPPASALVSQEEAEDALREGMAQRRPGHRGVAAVGSVAATLLLLSGFGSLVADARPGDLLYGLHAMMFDEPRVNDDQIMLSAKADLARAEQMIAQGQWDQAQTQLAEISTTLRAVNDGGRRQGLLDEVNQLNTKVEKRDPKATSQPSALPSAEQVVPSAPASQSVPLAPSTPPTTPFDPGGSATLSPSTAPSHSPSAATTPPSPSPSRAPSPTTTTKPKASTSPVTSPATSAPTTSVPAPTTSAPATSTPAPTPSQAKTTPPSPAPTSKGKPKPGATPSVTPNSPAAGPGSVAPPTPSGQLWDRTSGPQPTPRTPFPPNAGR